MKISDLNDKNIAILWFWLEWKSTLNFLLTQNINFKNLTILDINENLKTSNIVGSVKWADYLDNLDDYDIIIKSSGVPYSEKLIPYKDKIIIQTQLFLDNYKWKVIAITATKWKSTISSLIYHILRDAWYKTKLAGNIWTPIFDEVDMAEEYDYIILELSSYMLDSLKKKNFISVLWSLFPEHMDWHWSYENYIKAKLNVLLWSEHNVVHKKTIEEYKLKDKYDNLISYGRDGKYRWYYGNFMNRDKKLFSCEDRCIPWEHNLENICCAIAVADIIWIPTQSIHDSVEWFRGLSHRMEIVWEYSWIEWIDDSISTTPESTIQAIKTFWKKINTILLGGTDRGYDFNELMDYIYSYDIRNIVLFPDTGIRIKDMIEGHRLWGSKSHKLKIFSTFDMEEAVKFAIDNTKKWSICLLSTASPSYSIWKNFEEKWDLFKKYVKEFSS